MRIFRRSAGNRTPDEETGFQEAASAVTFADVAGLEGIVEELRDIVDYMADPGCYESLGARPPKGVLLFGDPGCGKTLLGRAVAGEVRVPFYFVSATSFVERYVGLGASRVRALFDTAAADAPCIVFIDEIDAVGRHRSDGGGDREFDHTLNQLLVELDGFLGAHGVVLMAATNRPDLLDPALVRPGRFDRRIEVPLPDRAGRRAILELYAGSRPCSPDVDWDQVAEITEGRSAAELSALVNEAALFAVRRRADALTWSDVERAVDRLASGSAAPAITADDDLDRLALHEAGHAIVALHTELAQPVPRVSLARRRSGPSVWSTVDRRWLCTEDELLAELMVLLGGRAAECLLAGGPSTLVEDDLADARRLSERLEAADLGRADWLLRTADQRARTLVEEHRSDVEAIAKTLRAEGSLSFAAVRELAGIED